MATGETKPDGSKRRWEDRIARLVIGVLLMAVAALGSWSRSLDARLVSLERQDAVSLEWKTWLVKRLDRITDRLGRIEDKLDRRHP